MMPQTTPPPVGLCVQDLTVRYGTAAVLQGVSFSVPVSGQLIGLLGVNGSGKTTLLKAAAGLLPHTGQCLLDGVPLESLSTRRLAQTVSYIPQQSGISVSLSAREVVLMGFNPRLGILQSPTAAMRAAADEALRTVGLADKAGQDYLTLSGGEKQLCILARTIAEDAPLLFGGDKLPGLGKICVFPQLHFNKHNVSAVLCHQVNFPHAAAEIGSHDFVVLFSQVFRRSSLAPRSQQVTSVHRTFSGSSCGAAGKRRIAPARHNAPVCHSPCEYQSRTGGTFPPGQS